MASMNNSIMAANNLITDSLKGAGDVGLHIDDIVELLHLPARKDVLPRLFDLQTRGLITNLPDLKWKIVEKVDLAVQGSDQNGTAPSALKTPAVLPPINLPGTIKFSSYKNSLQEYCQKLHIGVPTYKSLRENTGYVGTVSFSTNHVRAKTATDNIKDAELRAAFESLKQLGYISEDTPYEHTNVLKRKDSNMGGAPPSKQICWGNTVAGFKSRLNELAQKNKLSVPAYSTVATNGGFFSTVTFNGRQFKSQTTFAKKKDAEKSAAHMALHIIVGTPIDKAEGGKNEEEQTLAASDVNDMISEARSASSDISSPKNRLQEYCQRLHKALPKYETKLHDNLSEKSFFSTVTVEGTTYTGEYKPSKKLAEMSAAEIALKALGLMV